MGEAVKIDINSEMEKKENKGYDEYYLDGDKYFKNKKYEEAIPYFERALAVKQT